MFRSILTTSFDRLNRGWVSGYSSSQYLFWIFYRSRKSESVHRCGEECSMNVVFHPSYLYWTLFNNYFRQKTRILEHTILRTVTRTGIFHSSSNSYTGTCCHIRLWPDNLNLDFPRSNVGLPPGIRGRDTLRCSVLKSSCTALNDVAVNRCHLWKDCHQCEWFGIFVTIHLHRCAIVLFWRSEDFYRDLEEDASHLLIWAKLWIVYFWCSGKTISNIDGVHRHTSSILRSLTTRILVSLCLYRLSSVHTIVGSTDHQFESLLRIEMNSSLLKRISIMINTWQDARTYNLLVSVVAGVEILLPSIVSGQMHIVQIRTLHCSADCVGGMIRNWIRRFRIRADWSESYDNDNDGFPMHTWCIERVEWRWMCTDAKLHSYRIVNVTEMSLKIWRWSIFLIRWVKVVVRTLRWRDKTNESQDIREQQNYDSTRNVTSTDFGTPHTVSLEFEYRFSKTRDLRGNF